MMGIIEIIEKKKNKRELTKQEIKSVVTGYLNTQIPDYQMSALLMAIWFNGMNDQEINDLTMIMAESGKIIDLSSIAGLKVDKHSTGGVGDKTTLALLPMVAASGVPVPKISGRGLGHTGGTIDKLESISNFQTNLSIDKFINTVKKVNSSIIETSIDLAPADKKIYSLRDVTGTIDSIPLIASSIMSKKIAGGADAFVLNVTTGSGAFLKKYSDAVSLGKKMVNIGIANKKETYVIISSMEQPLGYAIGNSLEVQEAIALLNNQGPDDFKKICLFIGSYMLIAGGVVKSHLEGIRIMEDIIKSGKAFRKLKEMVKNQNGDTKQIENPDLLPKTKYYKDIYSNKKGYIKKVNARMLGEASVHLGAGREKKDDNIDLSVGIFLKKKIGYPVQEKEVLAKICYNDEQKLKPAIDKVKNAFHIVERKPKEDPLVLAVIDRDGLKEL
ncbi:MAG: thymidine phosphorylase [Atribacterota bacterium]